MMHLIEPSAFESARRESGKARIFGRRAGKRERVKFRINYTNSVLVHFLLEILK